MPPVSRKNDTTAATSARVSTKTAAPTQSGKISLSDKATIILRQAILDLRIEPGARLDERYVQDTFGISRTPAREAMNRLMAEGFLETKSGFGICARSLDLGEINGFFDAYFAEEKMIAHFCNMEDDNLVEDLTQTNNIHTVAQSRVDACEVHRTNREFHVRVARACQNFHILKFAEQMHDHAQRLTSLVYRIEQRIQRDAMQERSKVDNFHLRIIDCIAQRQRPELIRAMSEHAQQFHDRVCSVITYSQGALFEL